MKLHTWTGLMMAGAITAAVAIPTASEATRYVAHGTMVSGPASVRVWVDGGDVFPDYSRVTLWVRPERDCYTSLFLVDTAGFIHVLNVGDGYDDGWLYGGRTYGYRACDLGLDRFDGRGIAYVFAVGSPAPFDYSYYGASVYAGNFGFRIVGDPFVGSREFYMSLLPATCRWDYVGVSYTRFYVREWVRYPSYLCAGGHVRVGDACRYCEPVYASYRCNVAAPYEAIRPVVRYKDQASYNHVVRAEQRSARYEPITQEPARSKSPVVSNGTQRVKNRESAGVAPSTARVKNARVVSTSREIARSAGLDKSRSVSAPVVAHDARSRNDSKQIAYKASSKKSSSLAPQAREKGAAKKVRQAE